MSAKEMIVELEEWRGYSAYEMAVRNGFEGNEEEWLQSLNGRDGGVATVNGVAHDAKGNVALTSAQIPVGTEDTRTLEDVTKDVDGLTSAMKVADDAIDVGGRYIDNARFR